MKDGIFRNYIIKKRFPYKDGILRNYIIKKRLLKRRNGGQRVFLNYYFFLLMN